MTVITNTVPNYKPQILFAVGAVVTQSASYAFGPLSWPAWMATAAASQIVVFGLDALIDRALQSVANRNTAVQAPIARAVMPPTPTNYNGDLSDTEAMNRALQESVMGNNARGQNDRRGMVSYGNCALAETFGDELPIPEGFYIQVGDTNRPFHAGNLVLALLSQSEPKDPFTRTPIPSETLEYLAQIMGINDGAFQTIWMNADINPDVADIDPEVTSTNRVDDRFRQLHTLLTSQIGSQDELGCRRNFLDFLSTQTAWSQKFG